jgi:hypothetical protein
VPAGASVWAADLERVGVALTGSFGGAALVVADCESLTQALAERPRAIIVDGDARAALRAAGYRPARFLALLDEIPGLLVPLDEARLARYALTRLRRASSRRGRLRQLADAPWPQAAKVARSATVVTVAERKPLRPFLVEAAKRLLVPDAEAWLLTLNEARERARNVFHLFPGGATAPAWVLKFARAEDPGSDDERGLALAGAAGGEVAAHTPAFIGRFVESGVPASVETAAVGASLDAILQSPAARRRKLELIEGVVSWVAALARRTARAPDGELDRQVPRQTLVGLGLDDASAAELRSTAAVLQHCDVAPPNIVVDDASFIVVDWEHARYGLPLLDLLRFIQTSLPLLDRVVGAENRIAYLTAVFEGRHPLSPLVGRWVRDVAAASDVPEELHGRLALLGWLELGKEELVEAWLRRPGLGKGWRAR